MNAGQILEQARLSLRPVTEAARLEAEVLLAHVLQVSRAALLAHPERVPSARQLSYYRNLVRRRAADYPLPYLLGYAEFYSLEFEVSPEVLIPRPETETLVDLALACQPGTVVDVGAGSGCIAVSLALHLPDATIYAIEISRAALAVAQRNAERHRVTDRVQFIVGDVLAPRPAPVDLIVSNPPYVSTSECAQLPPSIRDYEPRLALDGGADGLDVIRRLFLDAPGVLHAGGKLLIEIGAEQGEAVTQLAYTYFPGATVRVHPDLAGRDRVLEVQT